MKNGKWLLGLVAAFGALPLAGPAYAQGTVKDRVPPVVALQARPFALQDVRILDGPFRHAMELDKAYLLSLDVDRLLHDFRTNAGLSSPAKPLGGWEEPKSEVRGHFTGHYLSACALMYASTGDERLKARADRLVAGLAACQAKLGSGYLSAYPESFIDRVETLRPVWAPYYTLHKIHAGLLDVYVECGNAQALEVAGKFGDWFVVRNAKLTDDQIQRMLNNEHGGVNEGLANLYALTGEKKYLDTSLRFNHKALVDPFSKHIDNLTGKHANTQIPKFIGNARQFELTGKPALETAARYFWECVAHDRSYVIGGHSDGEMFSPKETLSNALGPNTTETCNTYNMLKLTRHLFCWSPSASYADFYERALVNHILCSQNPETGMMCYYVPLRSGSRKHYNTPLDDFWCCTGTGIENHAKYGDSIYFHSGDATLYVNQFIASELDWRSKGVKIRQETHYPDVGETRLVVHCAHPTGFEVKVRRPWWADQGARIAVNGKAADGRDHDGWISLSREWKEGDTIELALPMSLRVEGFRDNPRRFAVMYGPLVLAAELGPNAEIPVVLAEKQALLASLKPLEGRPATFAVPADLLRVQSGKAATALVLEPFFRLHGNRRYMVYFDSLTKAEWSACQEQRQQELARQYELEARTVDRVIPGSEANEQAHAVRTEQSSTGEYGGKGFRHALSGWFSWTLKVQPGTPQVLSVIYWGSDNGGRAFDVLVDGKKIATERLAGRHPEQFYDQDYPLPSTLTAGKTSITVKFQAHAGNFAGGVFGCAVLKAKSQH